VREVNLRWLTSMHLLPVAFPLPGSRKRARLTRKRETRSYFLSGRAAVGSIRCRSSLSFYTPVDVFWRSPRSAKRTLPSKPQLLFSIECTARGCDITVTLPKSSGRPPAAFSMAPSVLPFRRSTHRSLQGSGTSAAVFSSAGLGRLLASLGTYAVIS
jgi:hypothetical protein